MGTAGHTWGSSLSFASVVTVGRTLAAGIRDRLSGLGSSGTHAGFGGRSTFRVYATRLDAGSNHGSLTTRPDRSTGEVTTSRELPDDVSLRVERASDIDVRPAPGFLELSADDFAVMVRDGDDVVGWVFVRVERPVVVVRPGVAVTFDGSYLWGLYVEPSHRGRGFGSALLSAGTAFAGGGGSSPVFALVNAENDRSIALFDALDFSVIDEIRVSRWRTLRDRIGGRVSTRRYGAEGICARDEM